MKSPAHQLALYLVQQGFGSFAGNSKSEWSIAVGKEPAAPENCITIYDTGGQEPDTDELDINYPTVQVRVRSLKYTEGMAKQAFIRANLIRATPQFESQRVFCIRVSSSIASLGEDDKNRNLSTSNYILMTQDN